MLEDRNDFLRKAVFAFKAAGDVQRLRVLIALQHRPRDSNDMAHHLGSTRGYASVLMGHLHDAGLTEPTREGGRDYWVYSLSHAGRAAVAMAEALQPSACPTGHTVNPNVPPRNILADDDEDFFALHPLAKESTPIDRAFGLPAEASTDA